MAINVQGQFSQRVKKHDAHVYHTKDHPVPGYIAGLCAIDYRLFGRSHNHCAARWPSRRNVSLRGPSLFCYLLHVIGLSAVHRTKTGDCAMSVSDQTTSVLVIGADRKSTRLNSSH